MRQVLSLPCLRCACIKIQSPHHSLKAAHNLALSPLKLHLRLLYKVLVTLCNYFIYWLASPTSLSKYIAVTAHPGAQYINLSKWKTARLQISTCDLECALEPFITGAHFQNNAASPSHHHPFSVHSAPWPWKYHQPSLTSSCISELTFLENN